MKKIAVGLLLVLVACQQAPDARWQFQLGIMEAFAEMVAAGVKPIALSEPLTTEEADALWEKANKIAVKYSVGVYRETDLVVTALFPEDIAQGKEVFYLSHKDFHYGL